MLRTAFAAAIIAAWYGRDGLRLNSISRRDWQIGALRGILIVAFGSGCFTVAMSMAKVSVVSVVTCLPFEALCGFVLFAERLRRSQLLGYAVAFSGVVVLAGAESTTAATVNEGTSMTGAVLLSGIAGLGWGLGVASMSHYVVHIRSRDSSGLSSRIPEEDPHNPPRIRGPMGDSG